MNSRSINCNHLNGFSFYSRCIFSLNMFLGLKSVAKDLKMDLGRVVVITAKSKSENPEIDSQVALQHFKGGLFTRVITCIENSTTYFINLLYSLLVLLFFPLDKNILESNKASSQ